jgi:predicted DNA-binding transcriptional regulator AlpA
MILLRYRDLVARGLFNSRMTMWRAIEQQGFPPGRLVTPNSRAWTEVEVDQWVASRPSGKKPVRQKAGPSAAAHGEAG